MFDWLETHRVLLGWLSAASLVMFLGSLTAIPWLVIRIPTDYFLHRQHWVDRWQIRHPLLRGVVLVAKNVFGTVLVLAGIAMLLLPGQGILTILVVLIFLDFPGKYALERRVMRQPGVARAINWIRAKAHLPPLKLRDEG
jgi:hypothetical protein